MTSTPRQFQEDPVDRQEVSGELLCGDAEPVGRLDPGLARHEAPAVRYSAAPLRDALTPVSNLSISSWYAISGTAMA